MNIDKGLALHNIPTGVETTVFPQEQYTAYAKLTRNERRKILARMAKVAPLKQLTYEQARLYHRLRGRL